MFLGDCCSFHHGLLDVLVDGLGDLVVIAGDLLLLLGRFLLAGCGF